MNHTIWEKVYSVSDGTDYLFLIPSEFIIGQIYPIVSLSLIIDFYKNNAPF